MKLCLNAERFYENIRIIQGYQIPYAGHYNEDTYMLISAGADGEYGTSDDICNFDFKYRTIVISSLIQPLFK